MSAMSILSLVIKTKPCSDVMASSASVPQHDIKRVNKWWFEEKNKSCMHILGLDKWIKLLKTYWDVKVQLNL